MDSEHETKSSVNRQGVQQMTEEDDIFRKHSGVGCLILMATCCVSVIGGIGLAVKGCQCCQNGSEPVKVSDRTGKIQPDHQKHR